ncbi:MAG: efflux RND transporter periplasmic adaptor subunit [Leeuwenhoekiella sp.]
MKKIIFLILTVFAVSCGKKEESVDNLIADGDLAKMRSKKTELVNQQTEVKLELDKLNAAIDKKDPRTQAALVTTRTLTDSVFKHYIEVQGNVNTDQNIIIYPEFSGILTRVYVKEGEHVRKGQLLAKIDDNGMSSQLARQEAQTTLAKTTYDRQKRLWDQKIGSEIQYLEAKTNYEASKAANDQLSSQVSKANITAPFSGVVDDIIADQGQVVTQGQSQVIRLVNLDDMYVDASIPESFLGKVKQGGDVIIELASLGKELKGTIRQVGNFVNPDNRTFTIKIAIPNADSAIKPNLIATVKINDYTVDDAITIPANAIQENAAGESIAYIYEPKTDSTGVAKQVKLEKGYTYDQNVEITSGLQTGQTLILEGSRSLRDGQEVKTQNQAIDIK